MTSIISIDQVNELADIGSLSYIRPVELKLTGSLLKPNTRYHVFFDNENVNHLAKQDGKNKGDPLISNSDGVVFATLYIPGFKFTSGIKEVTLSQENNITIQAGSNISRADAFFTTYSSNSSYSVNVVGNIVNVEENLVKDIVLPVKRQTSLDDALAQSFFTYGVSGGIFLTSIELYFRTKDNFLPVWVEIREMVNGFPGKNYISPYSIAYKSANDITVSATAASATKFTFPKLIYLPQDKEFCFVVRSRSNEYTLWGSRIGERSNEAGKTVTEQPYTGSLFKTDNNITWSSEQFEDIKFVLNRAQFNNNVQATVKIPLAANYVYADGSRLQTMQESNVVVLDFPHKHGLDTNSVVVLSCDTSGTYNGVSGSVLNGTFNVFSVITDKAVSFTVPGAEFTKTGIIETGGRIKDITVTNSGSGYSSVNLPAITISAPNEVGGVQATATAVVEGGKITRIDVVNKGTGYTSSPTVTISNASGGSGATAIASNSALFGVSTNRVFTEFAPSVAVSNPNGTEITATLETKTASFTGGSVVNYNAGPTYDVSLSSFNRFNNNLLMSSRHNEVENTSNLPACLLNVNLSSSRDNISPVIDLDTSNFVFYNNRVNDLLVYEDISSQNSSGYLLEINVDNPGAGYTSPPLVNILGGVQAKAIANLGTGPTTQDKVVSVTIINPGKHFFTPPTIVFTGGGNPSVVATATSVISKYNSELLPYNGTLATKYITKPQTLETVSNGIRVYVPAYSNKDSSFEVYIKTSLSSSNVIHDSNEWTLLNCDVTRNKSEKQGQELEYEFYSNTLADFDVYTLKIAIRTKTPWDPPYISNYRAVVLS